MTTVELAPDVDQARMRVLVRDAPAGSTLTRTDPHGEHTVRAGTGLAGTIVVDDYECPFGVPVTYTVDGVTAAGRLDSTTPWLTHPTDKALGRAVRLVDDDPWEWQAPGTVHDVIGATYPVVTYNPRTVHTGRLQLHTSWDDRDALAALLAPGSPLLLRVPPGCYADDSWVWPQTVTRTKPRPYQPGHVAWELSYQRVATPGGLVTQDPTNAWLAVPVDHASWTALAAAHTDWVAVVLSPHPHTTTQQVGP